MKEKYLSSLQKKLMETLEMGLDVWLGKYNYEGI